MSGGSLRIYLGFAPGAGTTYALLDEAHRRDARGTDVVVAAIDAKGRPATEAMLDGLEVAGMGGLEMGAVLTRQPSVVFVDDLAAVDQPGDVPRWRAVQSLRDAGFDVVTTLDVSHIESLVDVVAAITHRSPPLGSPSDGTSTVQVPDELVRSAEQIQLIDQTPEALRRRLAHGNIFTAEQVDAAVDEAFQAEALAELRELTLRWMADRVHVDGEAEVHEGIVVALSGAGTSPSVLRRAARLADRQGTRLVGVHVRVPDSPLDTAIALGEQRQLLEALGGRYLEVASDDVADALARVAIAERATQIVVGASRRSRWERMRQGALVDELARRSPVDVHIVHGAAAAGVATPARSYRATTTRWWRPSVVDPRRMVAGWVLAVVLPTATALVLVGADRFFDLAAQLIVMLLAVMAVAVVGGLAAGSAAAVWAFVLANWFFTPPVHKLAIADSEDALALASFLIVAVVLGGYVSLAARRSADAARARADASALAALAGTAAGAEDPLPAVVDRLRVAYGGVGAELSQRVDGTWLTLTAVGEPGVGTETARTALSFDVAEEVRLRIVGPDLRGIDPDVTAAFLSQLALTVDRQRLRLAEQEAHTVAAANELRSALLAAVSHDLRTPLASVKAASSALVQLGDTLDADSRHELATTIDGGVDRLTALVVNLLGMGRIQAGAVELDVHDVFVSEIVHRAALAVGRSTAVLDVDVAEDLPAVRADSALLEQVVVNLIDNARKWSPPGCAVRVDAAVVGRSLFLRIVDRGPGIAPSQRQRVRQAFQRVEPASDAPMVPGTGLGLAVASGFCTLMGVELRLDDTPGGGTTATVVLPLTVVGADVL